MYSFVEFGSLPVIWEISVAHILLLAVGILVVSVLEAGRVLSKKTAEWCYLVIEITLITSFIILTTLSYKESKRVIPQEVLVAEFIGVSQQINSSGKSVSVTPIGMFKLPNGNTVLMDIPLGIEIPKFVKIYHKLK